MRECHSYRHNSVSFRETFSVCLCAIVVKKKKVFIVYLCIYIYIMCGFCDLAVIKSVYDVRGKGIVRCEITRGPL